MRRWICAILTIVLVFSLTACSLSSLRKNLSKDEDEDSSFSFVITESSHSGLDHMIDKITWKENATCAVAYLGSRENYTQKLDALYNAKFSDIDKEAFDAMRRVDATGDEAYLVVPRFEMGTVSIFNIGLDSEGTAHVLRQVADATDPFVLFCNPNGEVNAQLTSGIKTVKSQFKYVPVKNAKSNKADSFTTGFQALE